MGKVYHAQEHPDQAESAFAQRRQLITNLAATIPEESTRRHYNEQANALFPAPSPSSAKPTGAFRIPDTGETLTEREVEVLRLIARGADNATIATEMIVSIHTVKTHVAHILGKLGVPSRTAAAIKAKELGLVK